jgi:SAM-dependent methyltransferase
MREWYLRYLIHFFESAFKQLPRERAVNLLRRFAGNYVNALDPGDGLRFLFDLDSRLYTLQGQLSVAYDGGLHTKHRHIRYHDFFVERVSPDEHVIDLGCGNGAVSYDMASKAGCKVVGVDLVDSNIRQAREKYAHPNVAYILGDVLKDLPEEKYDVVVLSNVLEHLPDRALFLRNVADKTGAKRFLIRVPLFERDWRVPLKKELGVEWRLDGTHETEYTLESFALEMQEAGLKSVHQEVRWGEIWTEVQCNE